MVVGNHYRSCPCYDCGSEHRWDINWAGIYAAAAHLGEPNDDVADIAEAIEPEQGSIMLVGHLPFLERLAALLNAGKTEPSGVALDASALLELTRTDNDWKTTCLMQSRLLPSS